jgi:4-hydroxythreonine-4-phosphate dehydrogenase
MIAITMGDANGVGPEIVLTAYMRKEIPEDIIVIGDRSALEMCRQRLGLEVDINAIREPELRRKGSLNVLDPSLLTEASITPGTLSRETGAAAAQYVETAARLALAGRIAAMVTLPINKEAVQLSIPGFSGHTEFIAAICGTTDYTMMLASPKLVVTHVSTHVSLAEAIRQVRADRIYEVIRLTHKALSGWIEKPRIAVAGLNPHAGEHGLFGNEEIAHIIPALEQAQAEGLQVFGPEAPDTVFFRAAKGAFDAVVCMYHDQGHIAMKLLDFDHGVNISLGLPIIRTSVDHGTAFDIAWQGKASTASLVAAVAFALRMI